MDQQIRQWQSRLEQVSSSVKEEFGGLDASQLNWKPSEDTWSIGQNLDHLITLNRTYFPMLKALQTGKPSLPWTAKFKPLRKLFGKMILKSVLPDRKRKIKTFVVWEPTQSSLPETIVNQFLDHQIEVWQRLEEVVPMLGSGKAIPSPASSVIVYNLEDFFEIVITHEERHLNQAREVFALHQQQNILA
ncbi:MAG: DinB family protein [Bacteroidota bacterium]